MMPSAYRLPTEPYPGLRPFLDHESALLQGRAGQVKSVIERLQQTHFVAVVGGSGCGKSSLIRAGVVPKLRASGIPQAGGYWVPVVCTPGTTLATAGAGEVQTPLTRLAWKFSQALAPLPEGDEAELRRHQIASMFARGAGFSRLVDAFSDELPALGPDRNEACFLFVIDQFEELFHPNNHDNADARLLVEAVIAHFFNPHPRCYVVMTMRSEHLADCAAYLDLPDAINRSMYLVRRLNEIELRDAIVGPAKVYLRLRQRAPVSPAAARVRPLPADVVFDESLIQRLLDDVERIVDDPDHLPLLQHVLGRLWESACRREGLAIEDVPATVTWADLERASLPPGLAPGRIGPGVSLQEHPEINTLRVSLDHWAQLRYEQHGGLQRPAAERALFDGLLRQLAYRDPNNGLYFQQRVEIDDPDLLPGEPDRRARLHQMLDEGFLDEVNYLFWDKENPRCETLKVSHEAFIRGWEHFRKLADAEADRFEEFLVLLRRCGAWQPQRDERLLLEAAELFRVQEARLDQVLSDAHERADWFRVLSLCRDGPRLAAVEPVIDDFLRYSRERQAARDDERTALLKRRRHYAMGALVLGGFTLAAVAATLVQTPVIRSIEDFADARVITERLSSGTEEGAATRKLAALLGAAGKVADAQREVDWLFPWSRRLDGWPLIGSAGRLPVLSSSEPAVNGNLRLVLASAIWPSSLSAPEVAALPVNHRFEPVLAPQMSCVVAGSGTAQPGLLVLQSRPAGDNGQPRGLFITVDPDVGNIAFHVLLARDGAACQVAPAFWAAPGVLNPRILLDARLRYLALMVKRNAWSAGEGGGPQAGGDADEETSSFTLYELRWTLNAQDQALGAEVRPRFVTTGRLAGRTFDEAFADNPAASATTQRVRVVPSWREPGGYGMAAGGRRWRVIDAGAAELVTPGADSRWVALTPAAAGSACHSLQQRLADARFQQPGFRSEVFEHARRCIEIKRGDPSAPGAPSVPAGQSVQVGRREQVIVGLYDHLTPADLARLGDALPSTVASLTAFERRRVVPPGSETWMLGTEGPFEGWVALQRGEGAGARWWGAPLTTHALTALGAPLCRLAVAAQGGAASAPVGHRDHQADGPCDLR